MDEKKAYRKQLLKDFFRKTPTWKEGEFEHIGTPNKSVMRDQKNLKSSALTSNSQAKAKFNWGDFIEKVRDKFAAWRFGITSDDKIKIDKHFNKPEAKRDLDEILSVNNYFKYKAKREKKRAAKLEKKKQLEREVTTKLMDRKKNTFIKISEDKEKHNKQRCNFLIDKYYKTGDNKTKEVLLKIRDELENLVESGEIKDAETLKEAEYVVGKLNMLKLQKGGLVNFEKAEKYLVLAKQHGHKKAQEALEALEALEAVPRKFNKILKIVGDDIDKLQKLVKGFGGQKNKYGKKVLEKIDALVEQDVELLIQYLKDCAEQVKPIKQTGKKIAPEKSELDKQLEELENTEHIFPSEQEPKSLLQEAENIAEKIKALKERQLKREQKPHKPIVKQYEQSKKQYDYNENKSTSISYNEIDELIKDLNSWDPNASATNKAVKNKPKN